MNEGKAIFKTVVVGTIVIRLSVAQSDGSNVLLAPHVESRNNLANHEIQDSHYAIDRVNLVTTAYSGARRVSQQFGTARIVRA